MSTYTKYGHKLLLYTFYSFIVDYMCVMLENFDNQTIQESNFWIAAENKKYETTVVTFKARSTIFIESHQRIFDQRNILIILF